MGIEEKTQTEDEQFQGSPNEEREWYGRTDESEEEEESDELEAESKDEDDQPKAPTQEELLKKEHDLQKGFEEVAKERKRLAELQERLDKTPKGGPDEEEEEGEDSLTPEGRKLLKKFIQQEYGGYFGGLEQMYADMVNSELARFANEKGVDAGNITRIIQERGLAPKDYTLSEARNVYEQAYAIHQVENYDEKALEQRIREKVLQELAEQGVTVEGVTPTPRPREESHEPETAVYDMTPDERLAYLKQKHPEWDWD